MEKNKSEIGFSYFNKPEFLIRNRIESWFPILAELGGSFIIIESGIERAIPEDVFDTAKSNGLEPIIHLKSELPLARKFNEVSVVLDAYARWGAHYIILGDKPNTKSAWPVAGWHYENLVDHFLDRFIPIANYAEQIGLTPVLAPHQPGGDYWDTAFLEQVLKGLKRRKLDTLIEKLCLSSYGYTFDRPLSWGEGGPERWATVQPYMTPEGQEDQLGFHNYEWMQAVAQKVMGKSPTMLILDAGYHGLSNRSIKTEKTLESIQLIVNACQGNVTDSNVKQEEYPTFKGSLLGCAFSLDTLMAAMEDDLSANALKEIFKPINNRNAKSIYLEDDHKLIEHYLLLPKHESGVSDVVLNKIRPIIKQIKPTVGFSLEEAKSAKRVSILPDGAAPTEDMINSLKTAGCRVEILPQSGIEIATYLNNPSSK